MLDTDVASYVIKGSAPQVDVRLRALEVSQVCISAVTRGELRFGVRRLAASVEKFLSGVETLAWDQDVADRFAEVRAVLEGGGTPIGILDTMIAAHALSVGAVLVTNNSKHFRRVGDLVVEEWGR